MISAVILYLTSLTFLVVAVVVSNWIVTLALFALSFTSSILAISCVLGKAPSLEAHVTDRLLRFLNRLDRATCEWQEPEIKRLLVSELEKAAQLVRKGLPYTVGRLDPNTNFHLHVAASKVAWQIRRRKLWIAIPKQDTFDKLIRSIIQDLRFAVVANWDAWILCSEEEMSKEDPGYKPALDDESTHHEARKASLRRVAARVATFLFGFALIALPVYALSNGDKDEYDGPAKSTIPIAAPAGLGFMIGSVKGSAAAVVKELTSIGA
jgi:hypothetical protein